jgi:hypothetical protein
VAAAAAVLVAPVVAGLRQSLALVLVGLAALALTLAGVWWALTNKGLVRGLAIALAVAAPLTVLMLYTKARLTWVVLVALWLLALAVAAGIAAEHGIPLLGISAGTRNHFAVDLGLDREDPSRRLDALKDGVELQVDLGFIGDRLFVNNASFGAYASVVQSPAYRDDKARTTGDRSRHASSTRAMRALLLAERGPCRTASLSLFFSPDGALGSRPSAAQYRRTSP